MVAGPATPAVAEVLARLADIAGRRAVLSEPAALAPFTQERRGLFAGRPVAGVFLPGSTAEVAAGVKLAAAAGMAIVTQGGNTGLVGGAAPAAEARPQLILATRRLKRIRALDAAADTLIAEAGCVLTDVQAAAAAADRLFPLSLAAEGSCQLGGNLATNAGGLNVLRYGNARALTLGLEVVLADGRIWSDLSGLRKNNAGYDLKQLFIGSEGTLGIITAASLRLFPPLRSRATAWLAPVDPAAAVTALARLRGALGERVIACELISRFALDCVLRHVSAARAPVTAEAPWHLLVEIADTDAHYPCRERLVELAGALMDAGLVSDGVIAESEAQRQALWRLREAVPEAQRREGASIKHDVSVPVAAVPDLLAAATSAVQGRDAGVRVCAFGHLGDGNIHLNLSRPVAMADADFLAQWDDYNRLVHDLVIERGGSIAAEHGVGQLKVDALERYGDAVSLALMRTLKTALDPAGVLNPGKVVRAGRG